MKTAQLRFVRSAHPTILKLLLTSVLFLPLLGCSSPAKTIQVAGTTSPFEYIGAWGTRGENAGQLNDPVAMTMGKDDNVFLADAADGYIHKFSLIGEPRLSFQDDRLNLHPVDIAVDKGGAIYIADGKRGSVFIYFPDGSRFRELHLGIRATARSSLRVAVGGDGTIYAGAKPPFGIHKFSRGLRLTGRWGGGAADQTNIGNPVSLVVGADGNLYVAEAEEPEIKVYSSTGQFLRALTIRQGEPGVQLSGIATDEKNVFAIEARQPIVHIWALDGEYQWREDLSPQVLTAGEAPRKIAVTPLGELLILDPASCRVLRFRLHL